MPTVYISYRRADSADITGRIYDHLAERYGRRNVVKDIDVALAGRLAAAQVAEALSQSDVALVVIGKRWLDASAGSRRRGIDDPHDPVRLELETALRLGVPIIPALVGGASMPSEKRLPESLRPLVHYNGLPVQPDPDFTRDMERVYAAIAYLREQPRHAPAPAAPAPSVAAREASSAASAHRSLPATLVAEPPRTALRRVTVQPKAG